MNNSKLIFTFLSLLALGVFFNACKKDPIDEPVKHGKFVYDPSPYSLAQPVFFPPLNIPADNPLTEEGVKLGRMLFYDPILSLDSTLACAGCHHQEFAFADLNKISVGVNGGMGTRNSMPLFNLNWHSSFFWDGRAPELEDQILEPVPNPVEMHLEWAEATKRLKRDSNYLELFFNAFGTVDIDSSHTSKAIAQFLRTILSYNSRFDKNQRSELFGTGEEFTESESNGQDLFFSETGECFHCHGGTLFASLDPDNQFRNNGLVDANNPGDYPDAGRGGVTENRADYGKFKAPSLRNIALTAPYMHDGRFNTLEEVLDFYNEHVHTNTYNVDPVMNKPSFQGNGLGLDAQQKTDIINFLKTLTDKELINNPDYASPF